MAKPITIKILGDASQFDRTMKNVNQKVGKIGGGLKVAGMAAGAGVGLVAVAGAAIATTAVNSLMRIEKLNAQTDTVIKSMGASTWTTRGHIEGLAGTLESLTGVEAESIQEGQNLLLTFGKVQNSAGEGNDIFDRTTKAMVDMGVAMGTDAKASAIQLGKALNDPVKGITALTRVGVSFTEEQKEQIKTLSESGDVLGAQKIILGELENQFGGSGEAFGKTTAGGIARLKHQFGTLTENMAEKLLPVVQKVVEWMMDDLVPALEIAGEWVSEELVPAFIEAGEAIEPIFKEYGPKVIKFFQTVGDVIGAIVPPIVDFFQRFRSGSGEAGSTASKLSGYVNQLKETFASAFGAIKAIVDTVIKVVMALWNSWGSDLVGSLKRFADAALSVMSGVMAMLSGIFDLIKAILTGKWGDAWDAVKKILNGALDAILGVFRGLGNVIQIILTGLRSILSNVFKWAFNAGLTAVKDGWKLISGFISGIPDKLLGFAGTFLSAGVNLGKSILTGIGDGLKSFGGFVSDIGSAVMDAVIGSVNWVIDKMNAAIPNSLGAGPFKVNLDDDPIPRISRAMGGPAGGLVTVGERGREEVWLPPGSSVRANHEGGGSGQNVTVNVQSNADPFQIAGAVGWALRMSGR